MSPTTPMISSGLLSYQSIAICLPIGSSFGKKRRASSALMMAEAVERQEADPSGGFHAGQRVDLRVEPIEELRGFAVLRRRHGDLHGDRPRRIEPGVDAHQRNEAADQQTGTDQQHERERRLDDDEDASRARAARSGSRAPAVL
jgi:hypothetical protein